MNVKQKKPDAMNTRNVSTSLDISSVNASMTRATSEMGPIATVSVFSLIFQTSHTMLTLKTKLDNIVNKKAVWLMAKLFYYIVNNGVSTKKHDIGGCLSYKTLLISCR